MKFDIKLSASNPTAVVNLPWGPMGGAARVFISNPTGSVIAIRKGANDIPSAATADELVPGGGRLTIPVDGCAFGLALLNPTASTEGGQSLLSNLVSTATVSFMTADEPPPIFGAASYQSLSLSDLTGGFVAFAGGVTQTVDVRAWGGAILTVLPSVGTGQGVIAVNISSNGVTFAPLGVWAFWPGIPVLLTIPRVVGWIQVTLNATAIVGEPAIGGSYAIRATLSEVQQLTYLPIGNSITKAVAAPSVGEQANIFVTVGVPAISVGFNRTTGTRAQLILETSDTVAGPWRLVTYREQAVNGSLTSSIYRSSGNLGPFTRTRLLDIFGGGVTGTLTLSMVVAPDENAMLQNIARSLGDPADGMPNVNQDIYRELASLITLVTAGNASLTTYLPALTTYLPFLSTYLPFLATYLPGIALETTQSAFRSDHNLASGGVFGQINLPVPGAWVPWVTLPAGVQLICVSGAFLQSGLPVNGIVSMAIGPAGGPSIVIHSGAYGQTTAHAPLPTVNYDGNKSRGYTIPAGAPVLWVITSAIAGQATYNITYA